MQTRFGKRNCIICGKEYDAVRAKQTICGDRECERIRNVKTSREREARRRLMGESPDSKICANCGKPFDTSGGKQFCSKKCRTEYIKTLERTKGGFTNEDINREKYVKSISKKTNVPKHIVVQAATARARHEAFMNQREVTLDDCHMWNYSHEVE